MLHVVTAFVLASMSGGIGGPLPSQVASGDATPTSAVLWARAGMSGEMTFEIARDAEFAQIVGSHSVSVGDAMEPGKWKATGLIPATRYYYRATDAGGNRSAGTFKTPAILDQGLVGFHMGVSGDWRGELSPYPSVRNVAQRELDLFVELGDTIYSDYPTPAVPLAQCQTLADFRAKHAEVYSERFALNTLAELRSSTSVLATLDDHEVTNDFAGGAPIGSDPKFVGQTGPLVNDSEWYRAGLLAFHDYNPIESLSYGAMGDPRVDNKPKVYRSRTYGRDAAVLVLDERSFRDQELPGANPLDQASVGAFIFGSFNPTRTMLGHPQLNEFLQDLLAAEASGVVWKFVIMPEPIQNLGVAAASDRYEGYAAERSAILSFVRAHEIRNVVFVTADIHGTLVNNLSYQAGPFQPQLQTDSWEIATGSVAFDEPFGPTVAELAFSLGVPGALSPAAYAALPLAFKEGYITSLINALTGPLGYSPLGLGDSSVPFTQLAGGATATNSYGWTEFEVDRATQDLVVTTWGIEPYNESQLLANPTAITARTPVVMSKFKVRAKACHADFNRDFTVDMFDYDDFVEAFELGLPGADFDGDGAIDFFDYDAFVVGFESGC